MVQFFKSIANEFFIEEDRYICCVLEGLDHMSYHILCYFSVTAAFEGLLSEPKKNTEIENKDKMFLAFKMSNITLEANLCI